MSVPEITALTGPPARAHEAPAPWYRYFWPWLVIALVASAVCASLISAYLAVHTPDAVVEHRDASE